MITQGMDSQDFHQENFDRIKTEASGMAEIIILPNGIQAKVYDTKVILTFYYRTKKYHLNISGSYVNFTPGKETKVIEKYFKKLNHVNNYMENTVERMTLPINKKPAVKELDDKGTLDCIAHLERKIAFMKSKGAAHALIQILMTVKEELSQYL